MRKMNLTRHGLMLAISYLLVAMFFISCTKKDDLKLNDSETNTKSKLKAAVANSSQVIIDDMTLAPDAAMHGVPSSYSWASGAAQPQPMPVPAKNYKGEWFQAMTVWGQVYIPVEGSPATNTRCQIRNLLTKFLKNDGTWITVQSGAPQGAAFVEDFANNASMDAGARDESSNGGGLSVIVGVGNWAGHNYHFWPAGRAAVDVNTIVGVFTTCEARLIKSDPNGQDDRNTCKNILQMGADWWLNMNAGWLPDWSANSGIGAGRTKWVTSDWQSFNMCTVLPDAIRTNPPISGGTISVTGVSVSPANAIVTVSGTAQLTATITPSNAANQNVSWTSSNTSIASVSATGLVTGLAVGSATITVTTQDGLKTATCAVTVNSGLGVTIPAKIEAENFNSMSGIATETTTDAGGGQNIGWIDAGDWMEYQINVANTGVYKIDFRLASQPGGGKFELKIGSTVLTTVDVPNTGGWQSWLTVSKTISLSAGSQTIRIAATAGGWNINWFEFKNAPSNTDLALNHATVASSVQGNGNEASLAFDGNSNTRWSSTFSDPQWIYVDLGASYNINRVKLSWEAAYGSAYKIQVSNNATSWTDIYSTTAGDGGIDDLTGLSGSGRYIRMYGTQRGTGWGYSLWSFEVYGN